MRLKSDGPEHQHEDPGHRRRPTHEASHAIETTAPRMVDAATADAPEEVAHPEQGRGQSS